jgi:hypothetical protein
MKTQRLLSCALVAALLLTGCQSTPAKRIARSPEAFAAMPAETQAKIRAGQIALFFTPQQVELAKGRPDRVLKRTTAAGEDEVWVYLSQPPRWSFGVGVGIGGGSGSGGVGATRGLGDSGAELRVTFTGGTVSAIEHASE